MLSIIDVILCSVSYEVCTWYLVLHKVCTVDGCFFCTVLMLVGGGIVGVVIEPVVLGRN